MHLALDSSVLAKCYVQEKGTDTVKDLCRRARARSLSPLVVTEVLSVLNRLRREGRMGDWEYRQIKSQFLKDCAAASWISLGPQVLDRSIRCLELGAIRTLDAIQIASAYQSGGDAFVTADRRQARLAVIAGLEVIDFSRL